MQIVVSELGQVRLADLHVFTEFSVRAPARSEPDEIGRWLAAATAGEIDGAHAWISPDAVAALAGADADDAWHAGFAGMTAYAEGRGWVRSDGAIRAHIERV